MARRTVNGKVVAASALLLVTLGSTQSHAAEPTSSLHTSAPDAIRMGFTPDVAAALGLTGQQAGRALDAITDAEAERAAVTRAELAIRDAQLRVAAARRQIQWPASRFEADQAVRDLQSARSAALDASGELDLARRGLLDAVLAPGAPVELARTLVFAPDWARALPAEYRVLDLDRTEAKRLAAALDEEQDAAEEERPIAEWANATLAFARADANVSQLRDRVTRTLSDVAAAFGMRAIPR